MFFGMRERGGELRTSVWSDVMDIYCTKQENKAYPRYFSVKEPMENMFIAQQRMSRNTVQERLQHPLPTRDEGCVFLCFSLLDRIVCHRVLGRNGGDDDCWIQLDQAGTERFELRIAVVCRGILRKTQSTTLLLY